MGRRITDKEIGSIDTISRKLDGINYNLFIINNKDYAIKIISTYGLLDAEEGTMDSVRYIERVENSRKVRQ